MNPIAFSLCLLALIAATPPPAQGNPDQRSEWMGSYLNSHKVGWGYLGFGKSGSYPGPLTSYASEHQLGPFLSGGPSALYSHASVEVTAYGGSNQLNWETFAILGGDLSVQRFQFQMQGDDSAIRLEGHVDAGRLLVQILSSNSSSEQSINLDGKPIHLPESVPLLIADSIRNGRPIDQDVHVFEPHQLSRSLWRVRFEEIEKWDREGRQEDVYRIRQEIGGLSPVLWMNREGEVYKEWAPFSEELGYLSFRESEAEARDRSFSNPALAASLSAAQARTEDRPDLLYATSVSVPDRIPRSQDVVRMVVDLWNFQLDQPVPTSAYQMDLSRYSNLQPSAELPLRLEIRSPNPEAGRSTQVLPPGKELSETLQSFLAEEPLVQTHHPEIQRISSEIVEGINDPWGRALAIYHWMEKNIQTEFRITLPSALEVLESRKGDCNEQSTLFAALARAAGVPIKICTGLVYQNDGFYYHAWNEVLVSLSPEVWIPIDSALKQVRVDATHIKFGEGGLSEQTYLSGLIGRIRARIVEIEKHDTDRKPDQTIRTQNSG